jgi:hypothetical protein
MKFEEVLSRFPDAKKVGSGWMAKCPAHMDHNPSLSISLGDEGRTLLKCHAGCATKKIVSAVGLEMSDLFAKNRNAEIPNGDSRRIVEEYNYCGRGGEMHYQVVRYDPKDFCQRRPNGKGGWIWNTDGIQKVLFRLPETLRAINAGKTVFICEGEKDVLAMEKHDLAATCNSGGAVDKPDSKKWQDNYTETLRSADVVIIADKDTAGRTHAQLVAGKIYGVAKSVRIIELPDTNGKPVKDSHDYFAAGGTVAELTALVGNTQEWTPTTQQENTPDAIAEKHDTRIFILPNDHTAISESARNIFSVIAPTHTLFVRAGSIVELARKSDGCSLEILKPESFRSRLERYSHMLVAWKVDDDGSKVMKPKRCSEDNARALLATLEARQVLPTIRTVAAAPVIVPDGDTVKILGPGYHLDNGGTLVSGGEIPPDMPADEATALLMATLDEFVFQSNGDKARAFAAMLTPALKMGGFIKRFIPVDVREADQPQTGKGFSLDLVRALYRESAYPIALKAGGVGSLDESISSALVSGIPPNLGTHARWRGPGGPFRRGQQRKRRIHIRISHVIRWRSDGHSLWQRHQLQRGRFGGGLCTSQE